jgi:hypothetical protein
LSFVSVVTIVRSLSCGRHNPTETDSLGDEHNSTEGGAGFDVGARGGGFPPPFGVPDWGSTKAVLRFLDGLAYGDASTPGLAESREQFRATMREGGRTGGQGESERRATMTAIWRQDGQGWSLLSASRFVNEAELHTLVEQSPQLLPLAGTPQLTVVGREVPLGGGYADLLAVESDGRLVVLEVKLKQNAESRRAVVAQVLMYAAFLKGLDRDALEQGVLRTHLAQRGFTTLSDAVGRENQEGSFDATEFEDGLSESLAQGRFRLVLVLDEAPAELVRLVGYLASVADKVLIDLVTVSAYDVDGSRILVPQRVDPEHEPLPPPRSAPTVTNRGHIVEGAQDFADSIVKAREDLRANLQRLCDWAKSLEQEDLVRLQTYHTKNGYLTLLPRLRADYAGLVTIWHDNTGGYLQFWRSVFERRAPHALIETEAALGGSGVGQGNVTREVSEKLLNALTAAYREAATGRIAGA